MGTIVEWAENEVNLKISSFANCDEFDKNYATACYKSALKALKSLAEDEHSGYSIGATKRILMALIDRRPLSPLTGEDSEWESCMPDGTDIDSYQNKRYSALFKEICDNVTTYRNIDLYYVVQKGEEDMPYRTSLPIVDEMFPVKFPYCPEEPMEVLVNSVDTEEGSFTHIIEIHRDNKVIPVDRYCRFISGKGQVEITREEYLSIVNRG